MNSLSSSSPPCALRRVAVDVGLRHLHRVRQRGAGQAGRLVDVLVEQLVVGELARRLSDETDGDVVRVRVAVLGARGGREIDVLDVIEQLQRREVLRRVGGDQVDEGRLADVVGQAADVLERLGDRHVLALRQHARDPVAERVVEAELALVDERQGDRTVEGLGHARDPVVVGAPERGIRIDVGDAARAELRAAVALHQHREPGRRVRIAHDRRSGCRSGPCPSASRRAPGRRISANARPVRASARAKYFLDSVLAGVELMPRQASG